MEQPAVAVLADDLIWSTRLVDLVKAAGGRPVTVRTVPDLATALTDVSAVIIDLTARAYDGIAAVEVANHDGHRVLCVGQHDDQELRKRALAAGAERVYAYRALFERGAEVLTRWLSQPAPARASAETPVERDR
jgi:DNA-binding NarL/FixJ family response regulator